jgi:hypothetical protein
MMANESFGNVAKFKYLGTENCIREEIKEQFEVWECYRSVRIVFIISCMVVKRVLSHKGKNLD